MHFSSTGTFITWAQIKLTANLFADLDSLASAIAYAWYATNQLQQLTIPLVQIDREDFVLRAENLHALERAGIDPNVLLTADEIPPPSGETYALVDHNRLDQRFAHVLRPAASGSSLGAYAFVFCFFSRSPFANGATFLGFEMAARLLDSW